MATMIDTFAVGEVGSPFQIEAELGLDTLLVRSGSKSLPRASGALPGAHFASEKDFTLRLWWKGDTPAEGEELASQFRDATNLSESDQFPYRLDRQGQPDKFVWVRVLERGYDRSVDTQALGLYHGFVTFEVVDPHQYSWAEHSASLPLLTTESSGIDLPFNYALNWSASTSQTAVFVNAGNRPAYPTVQVEFEAGGTGAFESLTLTNQTSGIEWVQASTLTDGQRLTAVFGEALTTITVSGADRYAEWAHPRVPMLLAPGSNTLRLEVGAAGTPTTDVVARLSWRDAWL